MLSKQPIFGPDGPTISPALTRRRDQLLGAETARPGEPRLLPGDDDPQPSLLPESVDAMDESEPDPEIPPLPRDAQRLAGRTAVRPAPRRTRLWPGVVAAGVVLAMGTMAWVVYDRLAVAPAGGDVPYITAEAGPEKVRPENEGGLEVPNQDIRVYNELSGTAAIEESEVLLSPPETPVTPPLTAEAAPESMDIPLVAAPELAAEPAAGTEPAAEPATPAVAEPPQTATTTSAFRIQLAAVKNADAAKAAWKKMAKTHADVLAGLTLDLVKVERAGGTIYRMQASGFPDRAAAETACGKLKQKSQDCLVVAP